MIATKTKTKKVAEIWPPAEIREHTKVRRAWLATEAARVAETPHRSAKLVGTGSYQHLSVYESTTVQGRVRHRGHCQRCGGLQVVEAGFMVLHGYERPGTGFITGRCPGVNHRPMETEMTLTHAWLKAFKQSHAETTAMLALAEEALKAARTVWFEAGYPRTGTAPRKLSRHESPEAVAAWRTAMTAWEAANPLLAAIERTEAEVATLTNVQWSYAQEVRHFEFWIAANLLGKPLVAEVVA